ncbi:OmpA family protein [uncultured Desulfuromonas sp.]|uniref:OmpA family protein n=1 Tax=uncultured Desulfuromonas sp. TaxID=181013 RepID=UPI002601B919|nr:OmpA family protein [uncultured Desulfuromonas sp.]
MKRMTQAILVLVIFGLLAGTALAENRAGSLTLAPTIGGYVFDGDQGLEDDLTYGVGLGYNFTKNWAAELAYNYVNTESEFGTLDDFEVYVARLNALYNFRADKDLVPFLSAGPGWTFLDSDTKGGESNALFNYGGGLNYFVTKNLALRGDVRHIITFVNESNHNLIYTGGLNYLVGGHKPAPPKPLDSDGDGVINALDRCPGTPKGVMVDAAGCPVDSDGDGVPDSLDKCPGTPEGVAVDASGCPPDSDGDGVPNHMDKCPNTPKGVEVDTNGCARDSDGDGVPDYKDKCPGTPRGVAVDMDGCPKEIDSDGDGVPDSLDQCPGTARGIAVDEKGCPVSLTLQIKFDFDRAVIKPAFHGELEKAAAFIREHSGLKALVAGHTDSRGAADYNQDLSLRRAEAVRNYLVDKFGIDPTSLAARGYGESRPVADNTNEQGRAENRRVEVVCCYILPQ